MYGGDIWRSTDGGGQAFAQVLVNGEIRLDLTPAGFLIGSFDYADYQICRSPDGFSWTCVPYPVLPGTGGWSFFPRAFARGRPGGLVPDSRLLGNGRGALAYSDDDGVTWHASNITGGYGSGLAVVDGGPLHGMAVAVMPAYTPSGQWLHQIFSSADGATWTQQGLAPCGRDPSQFGQCYFRLMALPGGLVAAVGDGLSGGGGIGSKLWLSGDAGQTWQAVFDTGQPPTDYDGITDLEVGPDGHLYLSVNSSSQGVHARGGVYRTVEPLFTAGEASPGEAAGLSLAVRPNPSSGTREAVARLAAPGVLRLTVTDATGRIVFTREAPAASGEHVVALDGAGWAAGVYVVRAEAGGTSAVARLVVTR